jgi:outer membrane translocation and assembly module TamA
MSKIHVDGKVPNRNVKVVEAESRSLSKQRSFFLRRRVASGGTLTLPHDNIRWLQVWSLASTYVYLDSDDTSDPSDGDSASLMILRVWGDMHISAKNVTLKNSHPSASSTISVVYTLADEDE